MEFQPDRRLLDKLLRSQDVRAEHRSLMNATTASRFVQALHAHEDPMRTLFQLDRNDPHLVRTMCTMESTNRFTDLVVMPFIAWLGKDALAIGTCNKRVQTICNDLARAPGVLDNLLETLSRDEISDEITLAWFLERLVLDNGEEGVRARANETHLALAKRLTHSVKPAVASQSQNLLMVMTDPRALAKRNAEVYSAGAAAGGGVSLETYQHSQPGGRHSNDHSDFRSVVIVPSVDEVSCEKMPYLPTPAEEEVPHLDRQFRLLRHDLVASLMKPVQQLNTPKTTMNVRHDGSTTGVGGLRTRRGSAPVRGSRSLLVLRNAKRGAIVAESRGNPAAVLIHFVWPRDHQLSRLNRKDRVAYLMQSTTQRGSRGLAGKGSNLLKRDSLVVLTDEDLQPLLFAKVAIRDAELLAGGSVEEGSTKHGAAPGPRGGDGWRSGRGQRGERGLGRSTGAGDSGGWTVNNWRTRQVARPAVGVSFFSRRDLKQALLFSRDESWGCIVPISVGVFAYEFVLKRLQAMCEIPLGITGKKSPQMPKHPLYQDAEAQALDEVAKRFSPSQVDIDELSPLVLSPPLPGVSLPDRCAFDTSQRVAVAQALRQDITLVQGPPGTGKTFLGVFLTQLILSLTTEKILCVCYTNHALDSFLEDLLAHSVEDIVRIGGRSKNPKLDAYQLRNLQAVGFNRTQNQRFAQLKGMLEKSQACINLAESRLNRKPAKMELVQWLLDEDPDAYQDLQPPDTYGRDGNIIVGKKGRALTPASIVESWLNGSPRPAIFEDASATSTVCGSSGQSAPGIWALDKNERKSMWAGWETALKKEAVKAISHQIRAHDAYAQELAELQLQKDLERVRNSRVLGCTTTGAAMHHALLTDAKCGVVLVEEAAEVLEAHVLTALSPSTKHLIMIGDHKQLRPKVEQYDLRVESGRGYNLNVSLFERLVKDGYPHTTLELQHRMPPEISALVKGLTYPGLRDGPRTKGRPGVRGLRDRLCFVAHHHKEETSAAMRQGQDDGVGSSKVNDFEVNMVTKTVRYLLLQGYDQTQVVVLTPYLAQLRELRDALNGVVGDQDAADLEHAFRQGHENSDGAAPKTCKGGGGAKVDASGVRIATVDNYQGEESDLVICSFVRSNGDGQIGFVGDPNRLNVAISRARQGMILFGDIDFFTSEAVKNKTGQRLWLTFRSLLETGGHLYVDGLPVVCEKHQTTANLSCPEDFDTYVPEGGCHVVCGATLPCDENHPCPRRCHPGDDVSHTKAACTVIMEEVCVRGHRNNRHCSQKSGELTCRVCDRERIAIEKEHLRNAALKRRRDEEREAAVARLVEARRIAALERENLSHELELSRLGKEAQRAEVDAERARSTQQTTRARDKRLGSFGSQQRRRSSSPIEGTAKRPNANTEDMAPGPVDASSSGKSAVGNEDTGKTPGGPKPAKSDSKPTPVSPCTNKAVPRTIAKSPNHGGDGPTSPHVGPSILLSVAQAANKGNARGLSDALRSVPLGNRERVSHELAVAVGDLAYDWFAPTQCGEPACIPLQCARTKQALGMMASGKWVQARRILAAVTKEQAKRHAQGKEPAAVYALVLCDHHVTGSSSAAQDLAALDVADADMWRGPPDHRLPPGARAFPLRALVRAQLGSASSASSSPTEEEDGVDADKVRAAALAVGFLLAPDRARAACGLDSPNWNEAAEAVIKATGSALAAALWGPEGGGADTVARGSGNDQGDAEDVFLGQWGRLQTKWGIQSKAMDELLGMSGLAAVKTYFIGVARSAVLDQERGYDPSLRSFNVRLEGNPGTGKTTVARLFYRLLKDCRIFATAEENARKAHEQEVAKAKMKAEEVEEERKNRDRELFHRLGLPYSSTSTQAAPGGSAPAVGASPAPGPAARTIDSGFVETTGANLADDGVKGLKKMLDNINNAGGGVLFIDEVLNYLLAEIENRRGDLVVALAGYTKDMEKLFEFNEGLPSRFPKTLYFEDYSDELLLDIFKRFIARKHGRGVLRLAEGDGGGERWAKVAIARLGRLRGTRGFGNARAVRVLFDQVMQRQADRLSNNEETDADPYELRKSDLLGTPVAKLDDSADWRTICDMTGLGSVKEAVRGLAEVVKTNLALEEAGKPLRELSLNRCMLGNPGTGKTTVAKLFAGVLSDLGLLSKRDVVLKTASDFIGVHIGESETKTRAILKAAEGCVLVIDEAYALNPLKSRGDGAGSTSDCFREAVIDTLVEQVQNVPGEDRCVLLLGYRPEMEALMKTVNPGLARRFALDNAFIFDDYTDEELLDILRGKLQREQLEASADTLMAAAAVLKRRRDTASHFGNGGEVANLLSEAKLRKENRRRQGGGSDEARLDPQLLPEDFDPEYEMGPPDAAALEADLFDDLIGCESIKEKCRRIRSTVLHARRLGRDPVETVNLNFRFTGAPGTGKTTVAKRVGRMFKALGMLHSEEVVSSSPSDFTTGYIGQAALKTKKVIDKAVGKVLFIDEAYGLNPKLGRGHSYMQEAVDQLVQCLTDDKYMGKMVVVVAGYASDIDELMEANPGLASRFPESVFFPNFEIKDCCRLLQSKLKRDFSTELSPGAQAALPSILAPVLQAPRFGNGRTITDLAKSIFTEVGVRLGDGQNIEAEGPCIGKSDTRALPEDVRRSAAAILAQMTKQAANPMQPLNAFPAAADANKSSCVSTLTGTLAKKKVPPKINVSAHTKRLRNQVIAQADSGGDQVSTSDVNSTLLLSAEDRDILEKACETAGMSPDECDVGHNTAIADNLRRALVAAISEGGLGLTPLEANHFLERVVADRATWQKLGREDVQALKMYAIHEAQAKRDASEAKAALDQAQKEGQDGARLALLRSLKAAKEEALEKKKEQRKRELAAERAAKAALQRMGVCPAGFQWRRQVDGWRCSAGGHFVSNSKVAREIARQKRS